MCETKRGATAGCELCVGFVFSALHQSQCIGENSFVCVVTGALVTGNIIFPCRLNKKPGVLSECTCVATSCCVDPSTLPV